VISEYGCLLDKLFSSDNCEAELGDYDDEAVKCDLDYRERKFSVMSQFHLSWFCDYFDKRNDNCALQMKGTD